MHNQQYIEQINNHEGGAWHQLFDNFYGALCTYSLNYITERSDAEDIVQDTMMKIWESNIHFNNYRHLTYYLYKSVYHNTIERIRMRKNNIEITETMQSEWSDD